MTETLSIMFVDDTESYRDLVKIVLSTYMKHNLKLAKNGKEAIEFVKNEKFDLIIADYEMPGIDGKELVESLRKIDKDVPIAVISGKQPRENIDIIMREDNVIDFTEKIKIGRLFDYFKVITTKALAMKKGM